MNKSGVLYIVATPIGHLGDMSFRAVEVLGKVDRILAEDTRHSRALLNHLGIKKPLFSLHAHNERESASKVVEGLGQGLDYALVSDAGTPLISDPGSYLVPLAQDAGFKVIPIPGACSMIAALSASGMNSDRFCFEGFLPVKKAARDQQLHTLSQSSSSMTTLFFEAPHRIVRTLEAMEGILGPEREIAIARELTKTFETIKRGSLAEIVQWIKSDPMQQKGEYVLIVSGLKESKSKQSQEIFDSATEKVLSVLLSELSISQATRLGAKITGLNKHSIYKWALEHSSNG